MNGDGDKQTAMSAAAGCSEEGDLSQTTEMIISNAAAALEAAEEALPLSTHPERGEDEVEGRSESRGEPATEDGSDTALGGEQRFRRDSDDDERHRGEEGRYEPSPKTPGLELVASPDLLAKNSGDTLTASSAAKTDRSAAPGTASAVVTRAFDNADESHCTSGSTTTATATAPKLHSKFVSLLTSPLINAVLAASSSAAHRPKTYLVVLPILSLLMIAAGAMTNFNMVTDANIWTPVNSKAVVHGRWISAAESGFPNGAFLRCLVRVTLAS